MTYWVNEKDVPKKYIIREGEAKPFQKKDKGWGANLIFPETGFGNREICLQLNFIPPGEENPHNEKSDQTPMEGHPPVIDEDDFEGIPKVHPEIVKEDVAKTGTDNEPENEVEIEVLHLLSRETEVFPLDLVPDQKVRCKESQNIHKPVPTHLEKAKIDQDGIQVDFHLSPRGET